MTRAAAVCLGVATYGYDTALAARISRDPLEDAEINLGPNLYQYVYNDPVRLYDPLGLMPRGSNKEEADLYNQMMDISPEEAKATDAAEKQMLQAYNDTVVDALITGPLGKLVKGEGLAAKACKAGIKAVGDMLKGKSAKDTAKDVAKSAVKDAVKDKAKTAVENLAPFKK